MSFFQCLENVPLAVERDTNEPTTRNTLGCRGDSMSTGSAKGDVEMKRLTLDETWTLCMKMWRWIAKQKRNSSRLQIGRLKWVWVSSHTKDHPLASCYFCEYVVRRGLGCNACPGRKIDTDFYCKDNDYHFSSKPLAFYAKLQELNKKRKAKK